MQNANYKKSFRLPCSQFNLDKLNAALKKELKYGYNIVDCYTPAEMKKHAPASNATLKFAGVLQKIAGNSSIHNVTFTWDAANKLTIYFPDFESTKKSGTVESVIEQIGGRPTV